MRAPLSPWFLALWALGLALHPLPGQGTTAGNEWIALQKARSRLKLAEQSAARAEELAAQGLLSLAHLQQEQAALEAARLDFQEALWQLSGAGLRVTVEDCLRTPGEDGHDQLEVVLGLPPIPLGEAEAWQEALVVRGVAVSLTDRGVVVGVPYAASIPLLAPGQRVHLRFRLLRPVETPTLVLRYRGEEHHLTVLPRARGAEGVRVRAVQPQLAASFGEEARFQFLVENLSERSQKLVLAVEGLPPACPFRFWDPQAQADVTALQLEPWAPPKPLELRVMLPQGETPGLRAQEPLHFAAQWVPDRGQPERVSLSLVPRGVPQVEVTTTTWLRETTVGKPLSFPLRVVNRGTAPASAVRLVLQAPEGFTWQLQPEELELLAPGSHREVTVILRATSLPEGEYTVRLLCQWSQGATTARGHEALLRVRLKSSGWVGGLLILALVTAGAAAGWFSWRKLRAD